MPPGPCYVLEMQSWRWVWIAVATTTFVLASCREVHGATTLHVDTRNAGSEDGTPSRPHRTLQAAIDAASSGDTIKVAAGTYAPIKIRNKAVVLLGGFAGTSSESYAAGTAGDFSTASRDTHVTRIAGDQKGVVVDLDIAGNTRIEGFYISGGGQGLKSDGWPFDKQEPVIVNNVIEDNLAGDSVEGGAIWCKTNILIQNNIIRRNQAGRGAGITCWGKKVHIQDNTIEGNVGFGDHGGGIYAGSQDLLIARNLFRNNETGHKKRDGVGGAMVVLGKGTRAQIVENVITANKAPGRASGIFIDDEAHASIRHNLIYANACGYRGGAAVAVDGLDTEKLSTAELIHNTIVNHDCKGPGESLQVQNAKVTVSSTIFWNNGDDFHLLENASLEVSYSVARESVKGTGNIAEDPRFADPSQGDFHLASKVGRFAAGQWVQDDADSPGIDAGDPALDAGAEPAPNGGRVNMGAFGGTPQASKSGKPGGSPSDAPPATSASAGGEGPGLLGSTPPPPPTAAAKGSNGCQGCSVGAATPGRAGPLAVVLAALALSRRRWVRSRRSGR